MQDVHRTCPASRHTCRAVYVAEVEEAQQKLLSLQEEAAHPPPVVVPERGELQKQIEEMVRERDLLRPQGSAQGCRQHPRFDRGGVRRCSSIAKIGTLLSQGSALLASLSRDEPMDGKSRSSLMSSMIEEADAKRWCVAASSAIVLPSRVGNQA